MQVLGGHCIQNRTMPLGVTKIANQLEERAYLMVKHYQKACSNGTTNNSKGNSNNARKDAKIETILEKLAIEKVAMTKAIIIRITLLVMEA